MSLTICIYYCRLVIMPIIMRKDRAILSLINMAADIRDWSLITGRGGYKTGGGGGT